MELPEIGAIYRHYKRGTQYRVIAIARHSETAEALVIYEALYADEKFKLGQIWARPATMFLEFVQPDIRRFILETNPNLA